MKKREEGRRREIRQNSPEAPKHIHVSAERRNLKMLFNEAHQHQQRSEDASTAANFLYTRIQELESTLVSQRMLLEQSRHRESALHLTVEGFSKMVSAKQATIEELEKRVQQLEGQDTLAQQKVRLLQHEADVLHLQQRIALAHSAGAATTPPTPTAGVTLPASPLSQQPSFGSFEAHDALLREAAKLRMQLATKTHESNAAMIALNGLLDLRRASTTTDGSSVMPQEEQRGGGGGGNLEEVANMVIRAMEARRVAELESSLGTSVSMPSFLGGARESPARAQTTQLQSSSASPQQQHSVHRSSTSSASMNMLARENLELKERLAALCASSPSQWAAS